MESEIVIKQIKKWLNEFVIGYKICPFAKGVYINQQIRYVVSDATTEVELLEQLIAEFSYLDRSSAKKTDTTLLIHPNILTDFYDYNDFLYVVEEALERLGYEGVYQVASFHPNYQFANTQPNDAENYTNRSPYPILHLLREESVEKGVTIFPNIEQIPEQNIKTMQAIGQVTLEKKWNALFD